MDFSLDADFSGCKSGWSSRLSSSFMSSSTSNTGNSPWSNNSTGGSSWSISNAGGSSGTASSPGGSSLITSLLSRTFNSGGHQDMSSGRQDVLRGRSQSITPDSGSAFIQIPSFARRGSLFTGNDVGGEGFSSSPLAAGSGNNGDGQQNNDNVEKECKQVFFDCAL